MSQVPAARGGAAVTDRGRSPRRIIGASMMGGHFGTRCDFSGIPAPNIDRVEDDGSSARRFSLAAYRRRFRRVLLLAGDTGGFAAVLGRRGHRVNRPCIEEGSATREVRRADGRGKRGFIMKTPYRTLRTALGFRWRWWSCACGFAFIDGAAH